MTSYTKGRPTEPGCGTHLLTIPSPDEYIVRRHYKISKKHVEHTTIHEDKISQSHTWDPS